MLTFSTILFNSVLEDTHLGWMEGTQKRYQQIQKTPQHEFQFQSRDSLWIFCYPGGIKGTIFCTKVISRYSAPVLFRYMNRTHCLHKTFCRTERERQSWRDKFHPVISSSSQIQDIGRALWKRSLYVCTLQLKQAYSLAEKFFQKQNFQE